MSEKILENCPYSDGNQCPQPEAVARAYLIPQLLDRSEVEATRKNCLTCGKYLEERRKYSRVKRPLQVVLTKGKETSIEGEVVDISEGGALIRLKIWVDFARNEKVLLRIYSSHLESEKGSTPDIEAEGLIKRIDHQEQEMAVAFLKKLGK